ncbi:MAG: hypothetical protein ACTSWW_03545 [Promethearchaeota archaeon]
MKITENRGVVVVLGFITLIVSIMLIGMLMSGQNFDNDRLNGSYQGSINIPNQSTMVLIITFDGKSSCAGSISLEDDTLIFSDVEYIFIYGSSVQFSIYSIETEKRFTFIGDVTEDNSIISGDMQYWADFDTYYNGTFYASKV